MLTTGLAVFPGLLGPANAQESSEADLTVDEIVHRTNHAAYYQGDDGRAQVHMTITDSQDRTRERRFVILRWDQPAPEDSDAELYTGEQKFYVYFERPADVAKMVFMVHKHLDRDDDRWLYMPALDLVKRIAASDKRTSFVGSDFFYEDVSGRQVDLDHHELVRTTENYYVLKNTPKDPQNVEFAYYKMWIHKETFLPTKIEYFDESDHKYREYTALAVDEIQGHWTVTKSQMSSLDSGSTTVMQYSDVEYDVGIDESIFSERYLRRPPRQYLR
jgi:outer membrane lipoprotein-sorting protein